MSDGLEILIGAIVALVVAGVVWFALLRLTRLEKHKIAWVTVALAMLIGILFINDATGTDAESNIVALVIILAVSSLVGTVVKSSEEQKNRSKK